MKIIVAFIATILFFSCEKENDKNCTEAKSTFSWQKDRSLQEANTLIEGDTIKFMTIHGGDDLLFTYQYDSGECRDIQDDDYTRYIRFVVPKTATSFSYTDAQLAACSAHYTVSGWWVNSGATPISRGTITGTLVNASQWKVNLDILLGPGAEAEHIVLQQYFSLK